jgi:hypothetical protein
MARAFFLFDFGSDEQSALKARHRIDAWKQAFRLGNKVQLKVERQPPAASENAHESKKESGEGVRILVRLDFSTHEKHLFQNWFERIPTEEPFKSVKPETIQHDAGNFDQISELFDSLD